MHTCLQTIHSKRDETKLTVLMQDDTQLTLKAQSDYRDGLMHAHMTYLAHHVYLAHACIPGTHVQVQGSNAGSPDKEPQPCSGNAVLAASAGPAATAFSLTAAASAFAASSPFHAVSTEGWGQSKQGGHGQAAAHDSSWHHAEQDRRTCVNTY